MLREGRQGVGEGVEGEEVGRVLGGCRVLNL